MALAFTNRASQFVTTNATSYVSSTSFTPTAGNLMVLIGYWSSTDTAEAQPTSVSGNGVTYSRHATTQFQSGVSSGSVWVGIVPASPTLGSVTVSGFSTSRTGIGFQIWEVSGADTSGTALAALADVVANTPATATSGTITMSGPLATGNLCCAYFDHSANETITAGAGNTLDATGSYATPTRGGGGVHNTGTTYANPAASWTTSVGWRGIGVEIKAASSGVNGTAAGTSATSGAAAGSATHHVYAGTAAGGSATSGVAAGSAVHHQYAGVAAGTSATSGTATGVASAPGVHGTASGSSATSGTAAGAATHHSYAGSGTGRSASSATATGVAVHHSYAGVATGRSATSASAAGVATVPGVNGTAAGRSATSGSASGTATRHTYLGVGAARSNTNATATGVAVHHVYGGVATGRSGTSATAIGVETAAGYVPSTHDLYGYVVPVGAAGVPTAGATAASTVGANGQVTL